jgi:hypothetical protein
VATIAHGSAAASASILIVFMSYLVVRVLDLVPRTSPAAEPHGSAANDRRS